MTAPPGLHALARLHGIQTAYHDHAGRRVGASSEALMAVLRALGVPVQSGADVLPALERRQRGLYERGIEPVVVAWLPDPAPFTLRVPAALSDAEVRVSVGLEAGGVVETVEAPARTGRVELAGRSYVELAVPLSRVPPGYHDLEVAVRSGRAGTRRHRALLIAAPVRSAGWEVLPGAPAWGVFAPLFALWSEASPSRTPDFGLLDRLAAGIAPLGGAVVGTLPLLASFLDEPYEPSPYAPVSKLFWNELYVADAGPGAPATATVDGRTLDLRRAAAARRQRLEEAARAFFEADAGGGSHDGAASAGDHGSPPGPRVPPEMAAFVARNPAAPDYARFRALTESRGPWPGWPDRLRARDVRDGDYPAAAARYHLFAQWQAERQLAEAEERAASRGVAFYLDLPLGVHPHGYDAWRYRGLFARGATAGAPPDPLAPDGQDWGFHPPRPEEARREGHRYFIAAVRKHLRFAGVLRLDHVMQFHRLFWVPEGQAAEGVYVRYPHQELYAILSLESHRAGAVIVGEDLGTVPRAVRRAMRRHGLPGTYVVQFALDEAEPRSPAPDADESGRPEGTAPGAQREPAGALAPGRVPPGSLAAIGTHDTPMFAAWWTGRDATIRAERGLLTTAEAEARVEGRAELRRKLARGLGTPEDAGAVQEALYRRLGRSDAGLVLATLEDLWLEPEPQNVPGTPGDQNWRRRSRRPVEAVTDEEPAALLGALNEAREESE